MTMRERAEEIAARTPGDRIRFVDFLRAASITMVVLGHWLVIAIVVADGEIGGRNVLAVLPWTHLATWVFQVMPLFFLVGGLANAKSWSSERSERGGHWVPWLARRNERLLRPTTMFLALGVTTVLAARASGADPELVDRAGWLVNIALWFLATYVVVAAMAPLMLALHERWGVWVVAGLVGGVALVDLAHHGFDVPVVGLANFALAWLALHQLGFLLGDGLLTRSRLVPATMAGGGLGVLVALTFFGPYPVSMVNVPGAEIHNTAPPTIALVVLGITQIGLVLLAKPALDRWLERPRVWMVVVGMNAVVLTIYLWHMVPVVIVALAQAATEVLPQPEIDSGAWLALRPVWIILLGLVLVPLVVGAGRFERGGGGREEPSGSDGPIATIAAATGVALVSAGLVAFTLDGLHGDGPLGFPVAATSAYVAGVLLLAAAPRFRRTSS